jgi:hypothetical protein
MRGEIRRQLFYSRGCHLVFAGLFLTVLDDRYDQPLQGGTRYAQPFSAAVLFHPSAAAFGTDQVLGRHLAILRLGLKQQLRRWLKRLQKAPQMGGEEVSPKCRLGDAICYAVGGASRGVLGFLPSDNPFGDGRCRGAESVRLRAQRLSGTAARAGRYSTGACGLGAPPPGPVASDASALPPPGATAGIQPAPAALSAPPPGPVASDASALPPPGATAGIQPVPAASSAPPPGPVASDASAALPTSQDTIAKTGFDAHGNPAATPGQKKPFFLDWLLQ